MKRPRTLYFMFFLTFILLACQAKKQIVVDSYNGAKMYFGYGGGFSGIETRYCLLDNGKLYKVGLIEKDQSYISNISRNKTNQIFANYQMLKLDEVEMEKPQNRYNFIKYSSETVEHKLTWSGQSESTKNLNLYYSILKNIIANK